MSKKRAVIYARFSSHNQTEQSIEEQIRVCKEYAEKNDIVIVDTYIDRAMTGTNDNRPDFQQMIKDSASKEWQNIIVYKLDRFSRNIPYFTSLKLFLIFYNSSSYLFILLPAKLVSVFIGVKPNFLCSILLALLS